MPRKGHIPKRDVLADPLYNNKVVTKLINNIMLDGKKGVAQKIVYGAFARVEEKAGKPALDVFEEAMNNIMPLLEVKARRIGGATYQVPIEVRPDRRQALALRWLVMFSRTGHCVGVAGEIYNHGVGVGLGQNAVISALAKSMGCIARHNTIGYCNPGRSTMDHRAMNHRSRDKDCLYRYLFRLVDCCNNTRQQWHQDSR